MPRVTATVSFVISQPWYEPHIGFYEFVVTGTTTPHVVSMWTLLSSLQGRTPDAETNDSDNSIYAASR